jgi:membrane protease YdiL (CAAX protease family)
MKNRSIVAVILLPFVTLGIYALYWFVSTKGELNAKGAEIPTAWLLILPLVNIWWVWKYFEGAEKVTSGKVNGVLNFILDILVTSLIPMALCQDAYNKMSENSAPVAA